MVSLKKKIVVNYQYFYFNIPNPRLKTIKQKPQTVCILNRLCRFETQMCAQFMVSREAHHVFYSRDDLCKDQLGFQVVKLPSGGDSGEQVSTAAVLHHQVHFPAALDHLVKAHYVGVAQLLHAADFRGSHGLVLLLQTQLVHDFNSYSL